jgi:hopene-associated glycosyltransferase HpnB
MAALAAGLLSAVIWIYLIVGRGRFWDVRLPQGDDREVPAVQVVAVVPARNEAEDVGSAVTSLLGQSLSVPLQLILVDDHSDDGTAAVARRAAASVGAEDRLTIVAAPPLQPGWTGKLWAVHQGVIHAAAFTPDFLLLTDADIRHAPDHVDALVRRALTQRLDLTSEMVLLRTQTWLERRLIPAFVFFFFMLYPPRWAADPRRRLGAAAGGCMLIRPEALARIGGIASIRGNLIDDCALAQAVKDHGGRLRLDVTRDALSLRRYETVASIWSMIARSAYTQLRHSPWLLIGTIAGLILTYMAPAALALAGTGVARLLGILVVLAMAAAMAPTLRLYRISPLWGLTLPLVSIFYAAATVGSAIAHWRGRGGAWKGRVAAQAP